MYEKTEHGPSLYLGTKDATVNKATSPSTKFTPY